MIQKISELLSERIEQELSHRSEEHAWKVNIGLPATTSSKSRSASDKEAWLKNFISNQKPNVLYLNCYSFERSQADRKINHEKIKRTVKGKVFYDQVRGSEMYSLKFSFVGPSVLTTAGQNLRLLLMSIFFDIRSLEYEGETIKVVEPQKQHDELAVNLLKESGVDNTPIYYLRLDALVETGNIIQSDQIVRYRNVELSQEIKEK